MLSSEETPDATSTIAGGVHSTNAMNVQIHFAKISGGIDIRGGAGPFGGPFDVTWNTIEDSQISGGAKIDGYNGFWMGFIRNTVNGWRATEQQRARRSRRQRVRDEHDQRRPQAAPATAARRQIGDSEGQPNIVTGGKKGQCAGIRPPRTAQLGALGRVIRLSPGVDCEPTSGRVADILEAVILGAIIVISMINHLVNYDISQYD